LKNSLAFLVVASASLSKEIPLSFAISFAHLPNLWFSLALLFLAAWFFGMGASASNSLTLEQVPKFRGTMIP